MNLIESVESEYTKTDIPNFGPGDLVRVNTRIREGAKERIQAYEGTVIRRSNGGLSETFTVRRVAYHGEGSERTFPVHSPNIESVQVIRYGAIRPSKIVHRATVDGIESSGVRLSGQLYGQTSYGTLRIKLLDR